MATFTKDEQTEIYRAISSRRNVLWAAYVDAARQGYGEEILATLASLDSALTKINEIVEADQS